MINAGKLTSTNNTLAINAKFILFDNSGSTEASIKFLSTNDIINVPAKSIYEIGPLNANLVDNIEVSFSVQPVLSNSSELQYITI